MINHKNLQFQNNEQKTKNSKNQHINHEILYIQKLRIELIIYFHNQTYSKSFN